ncbi:hypothetical protein HDV01_004249 [Terramyces sp. JEL0728]|nr:hypothetical protein HDV01_004249 [Terramyces sp. JEL0728]
MSIYQQLKACELMKFSADVKHQAWPSIEKPVWTELGDMIRQKEKEIRQQHSNEKWLTIRLDLRGFSRQSKRLFPEKKYNEKFGIAMGTTLKAIMQETQAKYGFTQSDEITVVLPTHYNPDKDCFGEHMFSGKHDKIISLTASLASVVLAQQLVLLGLSSLTDGDGMKPIVQFDARMAEWDTEQDAFQLILWRGYDCTTNGLSDAIYKSDLPNKKSLMGLSGLKKLLVLHENDMLPLVAHQAYGTFLMKKRMTVQGKNGLTGEDVLVERGVIVQVEGSIVNNVKDGKIFDL